MGWILILHDNEDMLSFLTGAVQSALAGSTFHVARNVSEGRRLLDDWGKRSCDLILASLTARLDASHAPDAFRRELTGLDFVQEARGPDATEPPALLLASLIDTERAARMAGVPNARLLSAQDMWKSLASELQTAVKRGLNPPKYRIDLDIVLRAGQQCRWSMKGSGGSGVEDAAVMDIRHDELEMLGNLSQPADSANLKFLETLGLNVYKVLMADALKNGDLEMKLRDSVKNLGGMSVARIRFNVDKWTHRIHLETLAKPEVQNGEPKFWIHQTPMFRKFGDRGGRFPLFKDRASQIGRVNCLLVEGNVQQFAAEAPFTCAFPALKGARTEIDWLASFLNEAKGEDLSVTVLRHCDHAAAPGSFVDSIENELSSGKYQLVHYAGHSAMHETSDEAYLVMGSHRRDLLPVATLSGWAQSVQFVFLSSCESANSQFVMKLVETDVPAVAGFAWKVKDDVALKFSKAFYGSLFGDGRDRRYLEYSFMRAKQQLNRAYPARSHWVAPILFMQVFDSERMNAIA
jgi:hypothetical protein